MHSDSGSILDHVNRKILFFCFLVSSPMAMMEQAFMHPWIFVEVHTFSPFALILQVLNRMIEVRACRMVS